MTNTDLFQLIISALLSIVAYMAKCRIESQEEIIKEVQHEIKEIKGNYLTRFEMVNKNISDSKLEIINAIHKIEMKEK